MTPRAATGPGRALLITVLAASVLAPLAALWGVGHAQVEDYLGPHRATFAADYSGEVTLDLGPLGNAYLPSRAAPIGVQVVVGGVGTASESLSALFSEETLSAYATLYTDPDDVVAALVARLAQDALVESAKAEAVLLAGFVLFWLRARLLAPGVASRMTRRRSVALYLAVLGLTAGSILVPGRPPENRIAVPASLGSRFATVTVDSVLLADALDRGLQGVRLLSDRQERAVTAFLDAATASLSEQLAGLPRPRSDESMLMGYSDLHCNQAMTELISRLARVTEPAVVLSSGDDTVHGTAAERGCIRREAGIYANPAVVVATGNHDSEVTETQMRGAGMTVLDGGVVEAGGVRVLGDDDPERNIPFSVQRTQERAESEEQLGQRLVDVARSRTTDVILVHQPAAAAVIMATADPPARLVLWGHFHSQSGPTVVTHTDGSWTVGMREGTAGGVRQPTITSFSTPFSPPLLTADVYFYFRDTATGLVTGVQPVHVRPNGTVVIDARVTTGVVSGVPMATRKRLTEEAGNPGPTPSR